jgi:hypothetical protein
MKSGQLVSNGYGRTKTHFLPGGELALTAAGVPSAFSDQNGFQGPKTGLFTPDKSFKSSELRKSDWVLSWAGMAEVLSLAPLRKEVAKQARKIGRIHQGDA